MNTLSEKKKKIEENKDLKKGQKVFDASNLIHGIVLNDMVNESCEVEFTAGNRKWTESIKSSAFKSNESYILCEAKNIVLTEADQKQIDELADKIYEAIKQREVTLEHINEGIFSKIIGGIAGFIAGPAIGKAIAKALGVERGILYDMLTSRLAGAALGKAIADYLSDDAGIEVGVK